MRSCVACRTARPKRDLVRVVRTPDGRVELDPTGRLGGRGAYVCRDGACVELAISKGGLGRALHQPVPGDLREALVAVTTTPQPEPIIEGGARGQE